MWVQMKHEQQVDKQSNSPILFPCMFVIGDTLLPVTRDELLKFYIKKHLGGNIYLLRRAGAKRKPIFVLDRSGKIRSFRLVRKRRQLFAWLSPVVDFVLGEYELTEGQPITCGELLDKLKGMKERHVSSAPVLRRFIKRQEQSQIFDAALFKEFWDKNCQKLSKEEWQQQYPEK